MFPAATTTSVPRQKKVAHVTHIVTHAKNKTFAVVPSSEGSRTHRDIEATLATPLGGNDIGSSADSDVERCHVGKATKEATLHFAMTSHVAVARR
jgi:hypothetical protein